MKSVLLTFAACLTLSVSSVAQLIGTPFPTIEAEKVNDQEVTLSQDTKGRVTLVAMAYLLGAEKDFRSWLDPLFDTFVQSGGSSSITSVGSAYDIEVYAVPMFTGIKAAAGGFVKRKVAQDLDERFLPHLLFYEGNLQPYFGKRG